MLVTLFLSIFLLPQRSLGRLAREQPYSSCVNLSVTHVLEPTITLESRDEIWSLNLTENLVGWNQLILSATT